MQALRIPGTSLTQSLEMQPDRDGAAGISRRSRRSSRGPARREIATGSHAAKHLRRLHHAEGPRPAGQIRDRTATSAGSWFEKKSKVPGIIRDPQPIQLRFNELISGVRSDFGVKVFGDDLGNPEQLAIEFATVLKQARRRPGVKVEQVTGLPVLCSRSRCAPPCTTSTENVASVRRIPLPPPQEARRPDRSSRSPSGPPLHRSATEAYAVSLQSPRPPASPLPAGGYVPLGEVATLELTPGPRRSAGRMASTTWWCSPMSAGRGFGGFVADRRQAINEEIHSPRLLRWPMAAPSGGSRRATKPSLPARACHAGHDLRAVAADFRLCQDTALVCMSIPLRADQQSHHALAPRRPLSHHCGVRFITLCRMSGSSRRWSSSPPSGSRLGEGWHRRCRSPWRCLACGPVLMVPAGPQPSASCPSP